MALQTRSAPLTGWRARQIGLEIGDGAVVLPLLATQVLWIHLVTDGPPALALGVDPPDDGLMERPPRPVGERVITPAMWRGIVLVGVIMAAGTLFVLDASLPGGFVEDSGDVRCAQTMAFTTLMLFQIFNVFNARSDDRSAFAYLFTKSVALGRGGRVGHLTSHGRLRSVPANRIRHDVVERRGLAGLCRGRELRAMAGGSEQGGAECGALSGRSFSRFMKIRSPRRQATRRGRRDRRPERWLSSLEFSEMAALDAGLEPRAAAVRPAASSPRRAPASRA